MWKILWKLHQMHRTLILGLTLGKLLSNTFKRASFGRRESESFFLSFQVCDWKHTSYLSFFTQTKFLENEIYTEKTRKLRQNTQKIANFLLYYGKIHSKLPIFRVKSVKIYTGQKKFTRVCPWRPWQISGMSFDNQPRTVRGRYIFVVFAHKWGYMVQLNLAGCVILKFKIHSGLSFDLGYVFL